MSTQPYTNPAPSRVGGKYDDRFTTVTLNLAQVAALLGVSYGTCWEEVRRTGELAGVRALRVGRRYAFPASKVADVLGVDVDDLMAA